MESMIVSDINDIPDQLLSMKVQHVLYPTTVNKCMLSEKHTL